MNELFLLVLSLSVSASVIALILFALRPLYRNRLSKRWQYYVWLVVVVRLLLPLALEVNLVGMAIDRTARVAAEQSEAAAPRRQNTVMPPAAPVGETGDNSGYNQTAPAMPPQTAEANPGPGVLRQLADSLWIIWLGVAAVLLARKITSYQNFARFIRAGRERVEDPRVLEAYRLACEREGIKKPLPLYRNKLAASPMLVGMLRPFILLPQLEVGSEELSLVLRHELIHHRRRDILYKWLLQIAACIHWFNPVVYLVVREVNRACELSCDEALMAGLSRDTQRQYGDTLLATVKSGGGYNEAVASVTLSEDGRQLKERLSAILKFKVNTRWAKAGAALLTLVLICVAAFAGAYAGAANVVNTGAAEQPLLEAGEETRTRASEARASLRTATDDLVAGITERAVQDALDAVFSGDWTDLEQWAEDYAHQWERWGEQWADQWGDRWDFSNYANGDERWNYLDYAYQGGYLVGAGIEHSGRDGERFSVTRQMQIGGDTYTVAFYPGCEAYADDAAVRGMIVDLLEQVLTDAMRWRSEPPAYFAVRDVYYEQNPMTLTTGLYDEGNFIAFTEMVSRCAGYDRELITLLDRAFQEDNDLYFLLIADQLPGGFDALAYATGAAEKNSVIMLSAMERFLDGAVFDELMQQCLGLPKFP